MKTLTVKRPGSPVVVSFPVGEIAANILDVLRERGLPDNEESVASATTHIAGIIASHIQESIQNGHKQAPPAFQQRVPDPTFSFEM